MLKKLSRKEAFQQFPAFPQSNYIDDEYVGTYPQTFVSFFLTLNSTSIATHVKSLAVELKILLQELKIERLTFLGDTDISWRYQDNDYKPVKESLTFLEENRIGKKFNGALQVDKNSLHPFIKHLFWLTRCNASLAYIHFIDDRQSIIGHICQYGNIHLSSLNRNINELLSKAIENTKFQRLASGQCIDRFSKTGTIKGRQIEL
jgi:hypothetical protein